jgi:hypothetical protein
MSISSSHLGYSSRGQGRQRRWRPDRPGDCNRYASHADSADGAPCPPAARPELLDLHRSAGDDVAACPVSLRFRKNSLSGCERRRRADSLSPTRSSDSTCMTRMSSPPDPAVSFASPGATGTALTLPQTSSRIASTSRSRATSSSGPGLADTRQRTMPLQPRCTHDAGPQRRIDGSCHWRARSRRTIESNGGHQRCNGGTPWPRPAHGQFSPEVHASASQADNAGPIPVTRSKRPGRRSGALSPFRGLRRRLPLTARRARRVPARRRT